MAALIDMSKVSMDDLKEMMEMKQLQEEEKALQAKAAAIQAALEARKNAKIAKESKMDVDEKPAPTRSWIPNLLTKRTAVPKAPCAKKVEKVAPKPTKSVSVTNSVNSALSAVSTNNGKMDMDTAFSQISDCPETLSNGFTQIPRLFAENRAKTATVDAKGNAVNKMTKSYSAVYASDKTIDDFKTTLSKAGIAADDYMNGVIDHSKTSVLDTAVKSWIKETKASFFMKLNAKGEPVACTSVYYILTDVSNMNVVEEGDEVDGPAA
jgi:hypothetical protein